jgi:DNA-binding Lrp family transcriptional regulator
MKIENRGGKRKGSGRKPKSQEQDLIEKLDNIIQEEEVIKQLKELIAHGDLRAIQLYLNYRRGRPRETKDIHINEDVPLFID